MTEEEFMQLLAKQVQREVERQLAPAMVEVLQVLKSMQKTEDQKKHAEEERCQRHRQRLLSELEDIRGLAGLDAAALPDKP